MKKMYLLVLMTVVLQCAYAQTIAPGFFIIDDFKANKELTTSYSSSNLVTVFYGNDIGERECTVSVYNAMGQLVLSEKTYAAEGKIETYPVNVASGVYYLNITDGSNNSVYRNKLFISAH